MNSQISTTPTRFEPLNPSEARIDWSDGQTYRLAYRMLRFQCPCANCVDEHTGKRTLKWDEVTAAVRPVEAWQIGRYALQIRWSDGHQTGMYHFDQLRKLCEREGKSLDAPAAATPSTEAPNGV